MLGQALNLGRTASISSRAQRSLTLQPSTSSATALVCTRAGSHLQHRHYAKPQRVVIVASVPETEEQRSPSDAPQEWEAPMPSKRPDIFPEFEKVDRVILPKPLPGDPEMPDEELEETSKRTTPGDPDPEQKPGEAPEPEPQPDSDPNPLEPERKNPDQIPEVPQ